MSPSGWPCHRQEGWDGLNPGDDESWNGRQAHLRVARDFMTGSTGPPQFKLVASSGVGNLTFDQALVRCRDRHICTPVAMAPEDIKVRACVAVLGPPMTMHKDLVARMGAAVADKQSFMVATEDASTLRAVLKVVDGLALMAAPVAGHA